MVAHTMNEVQYFVLKFQNAAAMELAIVVSFGHYRV
jgi:hypothetical protein